MEKSNCCNANVKVMGDTTHYYLCESCNKPCDIGGNIEKLSDEQLIVAFINKFKSMQRQLNTEERNAIENVFIELMKSN